MSMVPRFHDVDANKDNSQNKYIYSLQYIYREDGKLANEATEHTSENSNLNVEKRKLVKIYLLNNFFPLVIGNLPL